MEQTSGISYTQKEKQSKYWKHYFVWPKCNKDQKQYKFFGVSLAFSLLENLKNRKHFLVSLSVTRTRSQINSWELAQSSLLLKFINTFLFGLSVIRTRSQINSLEFVLCSPLLKIINTFLFGLSVIRTRSNINSLELAQHSPLLII